MLTLAALPWAAAHRDPEAPLLRLGAVTLTASALDRAAAGVAARLEREGAGDGDRVAVLCGNGLAFPPLYYGALRAGCVVAPLSTSSPPAEVARVLHAVAARVLACDPEHAGAALSTGPGFSSASGVRAGTVGAGSGGGGGMEMEAGFDEPSDRSRASSAGRSSSSCRTKAAEPLTSISRSPSRSRTLWSCSPPIRGAIGAPPGRGAKGGPPGPRGVNEGAPPGRGRWGVKGRLRGRSSGMGRRVYPTVVGRAARSAGFALPRRYFDRPSGGRR